MGYYRAFICETGHVIDEMADQSTKSQNFCETCGKKVFSSCSYCGKSIKGIYFSDEENVLGMPEEYKLPNYCPECGNKYPWTENAIKSAIELANEIESFSESDKTIFKDNISDLVKDTPQTEVAVRRFQNIFSKLKKEGVNTFKTILTDVISESVKKSLFGV